MGQPAARILDMHVCPMAEGPKPHVGGPIESGEPTVLIGGKPAARLGDKMLHGGLIAAGCPTVLIGSNAGECLGEATKSGATFVYAME